MILLFPLGGKEWRTVSRNFVIIAEGAPVILCMPTRTTGAEHNFHPIFIVICRTIRYNKDENPEPFGLANGICQEVRL